MNELCQFEVGKEYANTPLRIRITKRTAKKIWFDVVKHVYKDSLMYDMYCNNSAFIGIAGCQEYMMFKYYADEQKTKLRTNEVRSICAARDLVRGQ